MVFQSCKKEESGLQKFYATIQQYTGDKVYIEEDYSCWNVGDQVKMGTLIGSVSGDDQSGYYITFNGNFANWGSHGSANEIHAALYPSTIVNQDFHVFESNGSLAAITIYQAATQKYTPVDPTNPNSPQKLDAPMVAVLPAGNYSFTDTNYPPPTMQFKNICAMLKVTVSTTEPIIVTRIEVENTGRTPSGSNNYQSGRPLWGRYEITYDNVNDLNPILREKDEGQDMAAKIITKELTLECEHHGDEGGVPVSSSRPFYISVPPVGYDCLHVTVYAKKQTGTDNNGRAVYTERCTTLISNKCSTFVANTMYPLSVAYSGSWTEVPRAHDLGPYTVNESGKRIEFEFSNLHHDGEGYFFPPYQYDFVEGHDPLGEHDHIPYDELVDDFDYDDAQIDLGMAGYRDRPHNSNQEHYWTLLSHAEWLYLLNSRKDANDNDINRFACVTVASVPGLLLFPDNYPTNNASLPSLTGINSIHTPYSSNILSIPDFYKLENVGCVFLPCVFYNDQMTQISDVGEYWEYDPSTRQFSILTLTAPSGGATTGNIGDIPSGSVSSASAFVRLVTNYVPSTPSKK